MQQITSLIISFYNKINLLRMVFAGLERQTFKDFEVIIADDGSDPEIVKEITAMMPALPFTLKHVWHEKKGWQKNKILNEAILVAESEYLIFIDGDCIPHPKFIQEHIETRLKGKVISGRRVMLTKNISEKLTVEKIRKGYLDYRVCLPLLKESIFNGKKTKLSYMLRIRNKALRRLFIRDKVRNVIGCNFSVWKEDLLKVNGFDERFVNPGFGEDTDLDNRLRRIGIFQYQENI